MGVGEITNDAINTAKIQDGAILNSDINVNAAIDANKIANTALVQNTTFGGDLFGNYNNLQVSIDAINTAEITNNAITSPKILDNTIVNSDIGTNAAIDAFKIANTALVQNTVFGGEVSGTFNNLQVNISRTRTTVPGIALNVNRTNTSTWRILSGSMILNAGGMGQTSRVELVYGDVSTSNLMWSASVGDNVVKSEQNFNVWIPPNNVYCFTNKSTGAGSSASMNTTAYTEWQE